MPGSVPQSLRRSSAEASRRRCRATVQATLAATLLVGASVLAAPVAGASPATPSATGAGGATETAQTTPEPQALSAQSASYPVALQMVQRLGGDESTAATVASKLDAGTGAATLADGVARSAAAVTGVVAQRGYQNLLGRTADQPGLAYFTQRIAQGQSLEWVLATIARSGEFAARRSTSKGKVIAIYQAMLDRTPDTGGMTYFAQRLDAGASPAGVVASIQHSSEYGRREADAAYRDVLWRPADAGGAAYWGGVVNRLGRIAVRVRLATSAEFLRFGCDPIAAGSCMLPWPNDYYTRPDPSTATGRRVNLKPFELPANSSGKHIDPTQVNRSDGFSPGSALLAQVPGISLERSDVPTIDHLDRNGVHSPVLLYDTDARELVPTWTELDVHDTYANPAEQLLMIHPVRNLTNGHHYIVALRHLENAAGEPIPAPPVFRAYRDGDTSSAAGFTQRQSHMDSMLSTLQGKDFQRAGLYLAWDFTVASTANITGRMLHMRDDAFAQLGSAAPAFAVTKNTPGTHSGIDRVVEGTFQVPNYLTGTGAPGSTFDENSSGLPQRNGTFSAVFRCAIPTSALQNPARASLYGHGLFGSVSEVTAGNVQDMAAEHNMVFCGTNWVGMSSDDVGTAAGVLGDLSGFNKLADRLQQGVLNFLFLARLMKMSPGLAANPAFQNSSGDSVIAPGNVYYDGNSQGGIEGGVVMAVSTDVTRGVLGVSGMNYPSLLLPRSTDFAKFEAIMKPAYPAELDRMLGLAAIQLEWDRAEPDGYASHMTTDPLPGTPQHQVLMQIALGDHQVTDYSADTEARTIGAKAHCPAFDPGLVTDTRLLWGIDCITSYPYRGSAIVYFDSGADLPGPTDTPPAGGHDPHEDPRNDHAARTQKSAFLMPDDVSAVNNVCKTGDDSAPCHAVAQ